MDVLAPWTPGTPRVALPEPGLRLHAHRMLNNILPVRIKLAEYVAVGLPTISTPVGLRGAPHLAPVVRSASRQMFAEALRAGLPEPPRNRGALASWTWDILAARLLERYRQLPHRSGNIEPTSPDSSHQLV